MKRVCGFPLSIILMSGSAVRERGGLMSHRSSVQIRPRQLQPKPFYESVSYNNIWQEQYYVPFVWVKEQYQKAITLHQVKSNVTVVMVEDGSK